MGACRRLTEEPGHRLFDGRSEMTCSHLPASRWASAHDSFEDVGEEALGEAVTAHDLLGQLGALGGEGDVGAEQDEPSASMRLIISDTAGRETSRRSAMRAWITSRSSSWSSKMASQYCSNAP